MIHSKIVKCINGNFFFLGGEAIVCENDCSLILMKKMGGFSYEYYKRVCQTNGEYYGEKEYGFE